MDISFNDIGNFFDFHLINKVDKFFRIDCDFLLKYENWDDESSSFKEKFLTHRKDLTDLEIKTSGFNLKIDVKIFR